MAAWEFASDESEDEDFWVVQDKSSDISGKFIYLDACRKMKPHPLTPCSHFIDNIDRECVVLRHQRIGERGAAAISHCLMVNRYIVSLDLVGNGIGDQGGAAFAEALSVNPVLVSVDLSENNINGRSGCQIASALRVNSSLQELILRTNKLDNQFSVEMGTTLRVNRTLKKLDLAHNEISAYGTQSLTQAFEENNTLNELHLTWNTIRKSGGMALANSIQFVRFPLQVLHIAFCGIDDATGAQLGTNLASNNTLKSIDISHNRLGARSAAAFANCLQENSCLVSVRLGFNPLGTAPTISIIEKLEQNTSVTFLGLENTVNAGNEVEAIILAERILAKRTQLARVLIEFPERQRVISDSGVLSRMTEVSTSYVNSVPEYSLNVLQKPQRKNVSAKQSSDSLDLHSSVFAARANQAESKDFFDTDEFLCNCCAYDIDQSKITSQANPRQVEAIREIFSENYRLILYTFKLYSAVEEDGSPFLVKHQAFKNMCSDCHITDDSFLESTIESLLIACNVQTKHPDAGNEGSLQRFDFLDMLFRVAKAKYELKDNSVSPQDALRLLLANHLEKYITVYDSDDFRRDRLYTVEVNNLITENLSDLQRVFAQYSGQFAVEGEAPYMSFVEFTRLIEDAKIENLPQRNQRLAFVGAQMAVMDTIESNDHERASFVDFLDCIGRVADMVSLDNIPLHVDSRPLELRLANFVPLLVATISK